MSDRIPITTEGHQALKDEVKRLKAVDRPAISKEIGIAREHGDLKENAEYHAAKDKQGMIEARIKFVDDHLARAEVIDITKLSGERVVFGATVKLYDVESEEELTYTIVGEDESNLERGRISIASPIARGLIGKVLDDEVTIRTGKGPRTFEILEVSFGQG